MASAHWTPLAELDLEEILFYIAVDAGRPDTAENVGRRIRDEADDLARHPLIGEARPELGRELRLFSVQRWALVYRAATIGIEVIGVVDSARDFRDFFRWR